RGGAEPKRVSNWIMGEVLGHMKEEQIGIVEWGRRVPPATLQGIVAATQSGAVTTTAAKQILDQVFRTGADPAALFAAHGAQGERAELLPLVEPVLEENPGP